MSQVTRIPLSLLERHAAANRPAGYLDAARACGTVEGKYLVVDEGSECWRKLRDTYPKAERPSPPPVPPGKQTDARELAAAIVPAATAPESVPAVMSAAPPGSKTYPGSVPLTLRRTYRGVIVQERPRLTLKQLLSWSRAFFTGRRVSEDVREERKATCNACDQARWSRSEGVLWCGAGCGCGLDGKALLKAQDLTAYEENLPHYGCKHPSRDKGKGWGR